MAGSKRPWIAGGCFAGILALGGFIAWPNYQEASANYAEIESLRERAAGYSDETEVIRALADEVLAARSELEGLKVIPTTRNMSALHRRMGLPADGVHVVDQSFSKGTPRDALPGVEGNTVQAASLSVEQEGRFGSVFAVLRIAETMDQLLRVRSVRMEKIDSKENEVAVFPTVKATIEIDVLYDSGELP